jgi:hypothetical protein
MWLDILHFLASLPAASLLVANCPLPGDPTLTAPEKVDEGPDLGLRLRNFDKLLRGFG